MKKLAFYARAATAMHVTRRSALSYLPEYIALEVTNVCNFKCKFCPQSDPGHHDIIPKSYLSGADCGLFLRKLRAAGVKTNLMHWTLDGEPFMHKRFAELVHVSAGYGFVNTYFASNGMLCTVERLLEFPLDEVRMNIAIDFCADRGYFEEVRGTRNSWSRTADNIRAILGDPRTRNVGLDLTDIASFSESDPAKLEAAYSALRRLFGDHRNIRYRTRTFHNATGFLGSAPSDESYHLCPYPWTHFRIASNGDVVICCRDLDHKTVLGNLRTQSVEQIWNGREAVSARRALLSKTPRDVAACSGCDLPYDGSKFTLKNYYNAAIGRMQILTK